MHIPGITHHCEHRNKEHVVEVISASEMSDMGRVEGSAQTGNGAESALQAGFNVVSANKRLAFYFGFADR